MAARSPFKQTNIGPFRSPYQSPQGQLRDWPGGFGPDVGLPLNSATNDRDITDSVTASESAARALTLLRSTTDSVTASESAVGASAKPRSATESVTASESVSSPTSQSRTATDAPTLSENLARQLVGTRSTADSVTTSESVVADVTAPGDVQRTATDAVTSSESATRALGGVRSTTDAVTSSDSASTARGLARTATDSVTSSESAEAHHAYFRTATDYLNGFLSYNLDFASGIPAGWTNDLFFASGGSIFTRGSGVIDRLTSDGDPDDERGFTAMQVDFFTPDPINADYWFVEMDSVGQLVYVDNQWDALGEYGLYIGGDAIQLTGDYELVDSVWYTLKAECNPDTGEQRAKIWARDDPEPEGWMLEAVGTVGFWPLAVSALLEDALPSSITLDNAIWEITGSFPADTVTRLLVASRALTEDLSDEWDFILPLTTEEGGTGGVVPDPPPVIGVDHPVRILVAGIDVSDYVSYEKSRFSTYANGIPGNCELWIRDLDRTRSIVSGSPVEVHFRNIRMWGGWAMAIRREYVFGGGSGAPEDEPRWLVIEGADYNILFQKRLYLDYSDPTKMHVRRWPNGTWDSAVIGQTVNDFVHLSGAGISYDIHHVGTPSLQTESCDPNFTAKFQIGSAGDTFGSVMTIVTGMTGAIFYIDPDRVFHYLDDATKQSAFGYTGLSDDPGGLVVGYRDFELIHDGTKLDNDQYTWGIGQGNTAPVLGHQTDDDSVALHGLWQQAELRYDMYCQDSVDLRAQTWLYGSPLNRRGYSTDKTSVRLTVREPYFRVGDVVSLEANSFGINIPAIPVRGMELTFPTPWDVKCDLTISHEKDTPWNTYEFYFPRIRTDWHRPEGFHIPDVPPFVIPPPPPIPVFNPCGDSGAAQIDFLVKMKVEHELNAFSGNGIGTNRLTVRSGSSFKFSPETGDSPFASGSTEDILRVLTIDAFRCDPQRNGDGSEVTPPSGFTKNDPQDVYVTIGRLGYKRHDNLADNWFWIRVRLEQTTSGDRYVRGKSWADADSEPADWDDEALLDVSDTLDITAFKSIWAGPWVYGQAPDWPLTEQISYPSAPSGGALIKRGYGRALYDGIQINNRVDNFERTLVDSWGLSSLNGNRSPWVDANTDADFGINASVDGDVGTIEVPTDFYTHNVALSGDPFSSQVPYGFNLRLLAGFEDDTNQTFDWMVGCDPCLGLGLMTGDSLTDDFNRSATGGWGTGGLGTWGGESTPSFWSVDGSRGVFDGGSLDTIGIDASTLSYPFEVYLEAGVWLKPGPSAVTATLELSDVPSGFGASDAVMTVSLNGVGPDLFAAAQFTSSIDGWGWEIPVGTWDELLATRTIGVRMRFIGSTAMAKIWDLDDPEPSEWFNGETDSVPHSPTAYNWLWAYGAADGVTPQYYDNITIGNLADEPCIPMLGNPFMDPIDGGPIYGETASQCTVEGLDNLYYVDQQFLTGSTEVWVDGYRIRVGEDYDEHPRYAAIEIHSDAQVGGQTFDPNTGRVCVNYIPWVIEDPPPEGPPP